MNKPNPYRGLSLFRFSEERWNSKTLTEEELRFTPVNDWRELEGKDAARGDAWEGASRVDQDSGIKSLKLRLGQDPSGKWIEHDLVSGSQVILRGNATDIPATHGICFNMLTSRSIGEAVSYGENSIDLSRFHREFGPSLLVVQDVQKFLDLVISAIRALNSEIDFVSSGPVNYIDPESHSGKYNIYMKPNRFEWQNEFRITVSYKAKGDIPFFLHVPQLKSVCELIADFNPNIQLFKNNDGSNSISISQTTSPDSRH
nr:hypothetical protein [uncultured Cohaesibacter sp.]